MLNIATLALEVVGALAAIEEQLATDGADCLAACNHIKQRGLARTFQMEREREREREITSEH